MEILVLRKSSEREYVTVHTSTLHVSRDEILYFKHPRVLTVNGIPSWTFRDKKTTTKSILYFDLILMSTLTWITKKKLERKVKNKEINFVGRET